MAAVWCAEDQVLGRTVAIKVLTERFADDDVAMRRFKREARAAARVSNHPHVVTIFDVGDLEPADEEAASPQATRPFIVMEYLAGGTVADAMRVGSVRRQEAVRWIREAASALDHAHRRGIVHRDIKPANFLLNRSRVLHVADFGIARLVSEDTITSAGELFGTASYLSPEQALGRPATGASDRYALAVVAFELLTGERPFLAQHFAAQARQHIEDDPPYASSVERTLPPTVDDVLIRAMAKQPEDRFETAGAFVDALETALSGGIPIMADPPAAARQRPVTRRVPSVARHVPAVAAAGADAAALAAGGRAEPKSSGSPADWTPANLIRRGTTGGRHLGRVIALAALALVVLVVAAVAATQIGGSPHRARTASTRPTHSQVAAVTHSRKPARPHRHRSAAKPSTTSATTPTTSNAADTTAQTPEALEAQGHQEMLAGDYATAISTLRRVVQTAPPGSLTYAYGLYDLGRSMVLSGDPGGAVPILEQRLKIPNQTDVVRQELNTALQASGQVPAQMTTTQPAPSTSKPPAHHHHHAPKASGGAGLAPAPGPSGKQHTHGPRKPGAGQGGGAGGGNENPQYTD